MTEEDIIYEYDPDGGTTNRPRDRTTIRTLRDTGEKGTYAICILLLGGSLLLGILSSRKLKKAKNH